MKSYEKEVQQVFLDNEKAVLDALKQTYKEALLEIDSNIALLLSRQDADLQHVIYQSEYQQQLQSQVQAILDTLQNNEFETVSDYLTKSYEDGFVGAMYSLQEQGVPLIFPIDQEKVVAAILHDTKLSENLYDAFDMKDLKKKISGEISRGIASALTYNDIARNISNHANISMNNAMRIARTEGHRINIQSALDASFKAKSKGADVVKQWDSTLDGKTRQHHRELDGQIQELDDYFEVAGMQVEAPGMFGTPDEDCNCRCQLLQRARWALDEDITKASPDAPEEYSDDGVTKLEKIKAKDYDEFKKKYMSEAEKLAYETRKTELVQSNAQTIKSSINYGHKDVTKEWFDNAKPKEGKVEEADEYVAPNGKTYKIDGVNVKQNNSEKEITVANLLHDKFGGDIYFIPEVNGKYSGVKTPDYVWNKERWDYKELTSAKDEAIRNAIHRKRDQAENFIIGISDNPLTNAEIIKQAEKIFTYPNTDFVDKLIILKENDVIKILKRT